jgi:hypothetical protein
VGVWSAVARVTSEPSGNRFGFDLLGGVRFASVGMYRSMKDSETHALICYGTGLPVVLGCAQSKTSTEPEFLHHNDLENSVERSGCKNINGRTIRWGVT